MIGKASRDELNSNLEFRKIKSLKFLYEVNSNGTILRNVKSKKQAKIFLDYHHSKAGYYAAFVHIKLNGSETTRVMIHKVVAECWLGEKPEGYEIDHIDRNSHNNDYRNLRYVTHSEQMKNRQLSDRIIKQATANCLNYTLTQIAKPVELQKDGSVLRFQSITKAAEYIAEQQGLNSDSVRSKFKQRRKYINGYDVRYLRNAETGHTNFTE